MENPDRHGSTDGRIEQAKDAALGTHDTHPSIGDEVGEAAGGISGVLAGAAIGTAAGPVGTLIGGIAGAVGGWWAGRAVSEAAERLTEDDDTYYRSHYERSGTKLADRSYEDFRPAYQLGHIAANNPGYRDKSWSEVQSDLERGWTAEQTKKYGDFSRVSQYANEGFTRGRLTLGNAASGMPGTTSNVIDERRG